MRKSDFSLYSISSSSAWLSSPEILVCRPRSKGRDEELEHDDEKKNAAVENSMKRKETLHEEK
jgi:hypothetical protein